MTCRRTFSCIFRIHPYTCIPLFFEATQRYVSLTLAQNSGNHSLAVVVFFLVTILVFLALLVLFVVLARTV